MTKSAAGNAHAKGAASGLVLAVALALAGCDSPESPGEPRDSGTASVKSVQPSSSLTPSTSAEPSPSRTTTSPFPDRTDFTQCLGRPDDPAACAEGSGPS